MTPIEQSRQNLRDAFGRFLARSFEGAVSRVTLGEELYLCVCLDSGRYRVTDSPSAVWDRQVIFDIPYLNQFEWHLEPELRFYESAEDCLRDQLELSLSLLGDLG